MENLLIKPYEISVWEDILVSEGDKSYYKENKIAVIGSDTMTGLNKVYEPVFTKKANGERTLAFSLKYKYFDPFSENEGVVNPFAALLVNERKVKLHYEGKWYEFIVKDHTEGSEDYTWTYTCTDAYVLELSKNGYNLTFDTELNNNQGTAVELAREVVKDTDWQVAEDSEVGLQYVEEPIYKAIIESVTGIDFLNVDEDTAASFSVGQKIYLFYNYINNKDGQFVQFIEYDEEKDYTIDSKNVITDTNYRIKNVLEYKENQYVIINNPSGNPKEQNWYELDGEEYILTEDTEVQNEKDYYEFILYSFWLDDVLVIAAVELETLYQANRLAYNQLTTYDPVMQRTVDIFRSNDGTETNEVEVYRYKDYLYTTSNVVTNFITNGENFNSLEDGTLQGWNPYTDQAGEAKVNKLELVTYPEIGAGIKLVDIDLLSQIQGYMKTTFNGPKVVDTKGTIYNTVYNSGFENNSSIIQSVAKGDKFVLRWRAGIDDSNNESPDLSNLKSFKNIKALVARYSQDEPTRFGYYYKHIDKNNIIMEFTGTPGDPLNNYVRGGELRDYYVLTKDIEPVEGKKYYVYDAENDTYEKVDEPGDNPSALGYYEKKRHYVIDGVAQEPSTRYIYVNGAYESTTDESVQTGKTYYIYDITTGEYHEVENPSGNPKVQGWYEKDKEYVWNGLLGDFEILDSEDWTNYLPYYYLVTEATKVVPNAYFKDPTKKYGIFIYTDDDSLVKEVSIEGDESTEKVVKTIEPKSNTDIYVYLGSSETPITFHEGTARTEEVDGITVSYDNKKESITLTKTEGELGIYKITYTALVSIFIQDIQLTRYIEDADKLPVLIGNTPNATSTPTDYYYIKPSDGTAAEDIVTYTDIQKLQKDVGIQTVIPVYNEDSQKVLTISESKSNCFNILQSIAETFECWIELDVEHDDRGAIVLDDGRPRKFVRLNQYAGKDNFAGFKYGINLDTIQRTVNSDEIVTKLIVDQSQSDYVDEGFISISSAKSNPMKESYILNFDYFYGQGLLDREKAESERLKFIDDIAKVNDELSTLEKQRIDLEAALTSIGSSRNVYSTLIDSAKETKSTALGEFLELTGMSYQEYKEKQEDAVEYEGRFYIETTDTKVEKGKAYYTYNKQTGVVTKIEIIDQSVNPSGEHWYELLIDYSEEETLYGIIGDIYVSSAMINNYSGLFSNKNEEYRTKDRKLNGDKDYNVKVWVAFDEREDRHIIVSLDDYLPNFKFILGEDEYVSDLNIKYFDITSNVTSITFVPPQNYSMKTTSYEIDDSKTISFPIVYSGADKVEGLVHEINEKRKEKEEILNAFNNKYRRFIQEGTWSSTDYISSELYYLDALQVSNTSAQPTISYDINVIEISQLEGFEGYLFDAGDKTYVEDTEFFGWNNKNGILTPAREEVIVSEVEWHLDQPDQNKITVQNYKSRFEDFFQRISATVQTVQYNEATYAKISSLLDANGTINEDVLLDSMSRIGGKGYALTSDGSVIIDGENVLIRNLTNPANRVILNSEGIQISEDGGINYRTAISGHGINIGEVYTGTLNTDNVIIGSSEYPSFRWDKSGISAYKSTDDTTKPYDLKTYVRFDEYGLYGIRRDENESFKAQSLEDVKNNAHFAVTWDGFFIKNSYEDGGRVSITSDNDFQITKTTGGLEKEVIKIGMLELRPDNENGNLYGMRIKNANNENAFIADSDGELSITGTINATGGNFTGTVNVGSENSSHIVIDGANAWIKSSNYNAEPSTSATQGWIINKDGDAVFNNITARGAIKTAVFEYAEIQAVGGVFLFRPSSTIRSAAVDGQNLRIEVEKQHLFQVDDWVKVSNYITNGGEPDAAAVLSENGLTHVYRVSSVNGKVVVLEGAAAMVQGNTKVTDIENLVGGALVSMGNYQEGVNSNNYGIGVNSSDNTVNLPRRAISLFETSIDPSESVKVTYNYRGILGTLPPMSDGVDPTIYNNMVNTQGIYTDNMYLGGPDEYIAFYTKNSNKYLDIVTNTIVVGAEGYIQSSNYVRGSNPKFASEGSRIDLRNGDIITKYFRVSQGMDSLNVGAYIYGTIEAISGQIGSDNTNYWEIGNYTDYNLHDSATLIGHGSSFIQLGDSTTWRLATNRIHTGWYINSDSYLHFPRFTDGTSEKYWDYGIHVPTSKSDKFLYIRNANATTPLANLIYDLEDSAPSHSWQYKLLIDGEGNIRAKNFYIGDSPTPIGGGTGTIAEKIINEDGTFGKGTTTNPIYIDSEGRPQFITDGTNPITIAKSVPSDALFTDHITSANTTGNGNAVTSITSDSNGNLTVNKDLTFLTSFTETDPTVPSWAKQASKPSYSYDEINGTVPTSALPSYVDDVLEYNTFNDFPTMGESGKIYIAKDTNKTYRWGGTAYVEISSSLALGETDSTAYRGDRGKIAYDHAVAKGNAFANGLYKITTNSEGHVTAAVAVQGSDIPNITKSQISDFPNTWALSNITGADDLQAIEALSGTSGLLKKTAANTWTLDTSGTLPNPKKLTIQVYGGTSTPTNTEYYGGENVDTSVSVAGTSAITNVSASAASGGITTFTLTKANGSTSSFEVTITGSIATGATTLTDSNGNLINEGNATKPVYFSSGIPVAATYELKPMVGATSSVDGTVGYVNATPPSDGYNTKYLRADGTWAIPTGVIPSNTGNSTTGISIADHSTTTIYGVSDTTSVYGVKSGTNSTTIASHVKSGGNGTAPSLTITNTSCDDITAWNAGQGAASLELAMDTTDTKKLKITFSHTHIVPSLSYTARTVGSASGWNAGTASTWAFEDVTVPIRADSATTVPVKSATATTVVTGKTHVITDNGHTHEI